MGVVLKRFHAVAFAWLLTCAPAMAQSDTISPVLQLLLMGTGNDANTWGTNTNNNLKTIENAIGGVQFINTTGGTTTLTAAQAHNAMLLIGGALISNATIVVPAPQGYSWLVVNNTTGNFTLTVKTAASGGLTATVTQFQSALLRSDGTNILPSDQSSINSVVNTAITTAENGAVPPATILDYAGVAPPTGYHFCDGSALSRTTYASLFNVIGTGYGAGDGSTTFNIPDMRGRVRAAPDGGTGRFLGFVLGQTGGVPQHTMVTAEMPSHTHTVNDPAHKHTVNDPGHLHSYFGPAANLTASAGGEIVSASSGNVNTATATTGITLANATTGITLGSTGSGTPFNTFQPTIAMNCIIKIQ